MPRHVKFFGVCAVLSSFCTLFLLQSAGGTLLSADSPPWVELSVYAVSVFAAAVVLKLLSKLIFRFSDREEEAAFSPAEAKQSPPSEKGIFAAFAAVTAVLSAMGVLLSVFSAGEAPKHLILSAAAGIFLKAPLEEYLFRYLYVNVLVKGGAGVSLAVMLQAVLFALWHPSGMRIFALSAAVLFGLIVSFSAKNGRVSKKALLLSVLSHGIYNASVYAVAFLK